MAIGCSIMKHKLARWQKNKKMKKSYLPTSRTSPTDEARLRPNLIVFKKNLRAGRKFEWEEGWGLPNRGGFCQKKEGPCVEAQGLVQAIQTAKRN